MNSQMKKSKNKLSVYTLMNNYNQNHTMEDKILYFSMIDCLRDHLKDSFQKEALSNKMI